MRARDFFIITGDFTSSGNAETLQIVVSTGSPAIAPSFQAATSNKGSTPYGNFNVFVDSLTISGGAINGNFGKSSITSESTDSIDAILIAARG